MVKVGSEAFSRVAHFAIDAWSAIRKAWYDARAWFDNFFRTLDTDATEVWNRMALAGKVAAIAIKKAFDWSFDSAEATAQAMLDFAKAQKVVTQRRQTRDDNQASLTTSSQEAEADAATQKAAVDAAIEKSINLITTDRSGSIADNDEKLRRAMEDLQKAIADAAVKRGALPVPETGPGATQFGQEDVDRIKSNAQAGANESKVSVVGSFNSSVLGQMFGSITLEQRTATAAEVTARNTEDMVRLMREGGSTGGVAFA